MPFTPELLDELLKDYQKPDDLILATQPRKRPQVAVLASMNNQHRHSKAISGQVFMPGQQSRFTESDSLNIKLYRCRLQVSMCHL